MKKFFQIPLLQCCRPFRLKETQTDLSYLAGNFNHVSDSPEYVAKDSTSYSLEYDTSLQNNSSCNVTLKNIEPDPSSCGHCTKCLLVNFDRKSHNNEFGCDFYKPILNRFNTKDDLILSVELDNRISSQYFIRNAQPVPLENKFPANNSDKYSRLHPKAIERHIIIVYESVSMIYFKTSVIMINNFQNNVTTLLNFSQAIHLRTVTLNIPISIRPLVGTLAIRFILVASENKYLRSFTDSIMSKIKILKRIKTLHKATSSQIKIEKPLLVRHRKQRKQTYRKNKIKSTYKIKNKKPMNANLAVTDNKFSKSIPTPNPMTPSIKLTPINKCEDYKDFLEIWKLRRSKPKLLIAERRDSNISVMTNSTLVAKSPDSQTRDFMLKYIKNQFRNKPVNFKNSKFMQNSFRKSIRTILYERNSTKPLSMIRDQSITSRNRIIEILVEIIYDKVIILMVDKLLISSNNFDEIFFGSNKQPSRSKYEESSESYQTKLLSNCNDNFINTDRSISSTSNTRDFTESTAFDIISDQAYSDNSDCSLSK